MCVDRTYVICVTPFGTAASEVDDPITSEELKREKDKIKYLEMTDTVRHEKILKTIECRKQKTYKKVLYESFFVLQERKC